MAKIALELFLIPNSNLSTKAYKFQFWVRGTQVGGLDYLVRCLPSRPNHLRNIVIRANSMNTKIQFLGSITSYDMCDNVKGGTSNINNIEGWKLKKSTKNYKTALNLFFPLLQVCTFQPFLAQCILYARHNTFSPCPLKW